MMICLGKELNIFFRKKAKIEIDSKYDTYIKIKNKITDMDILEKSEIDFINNMSNHSKINIIETFNNVNNNMIYVLTNNFDKMDNV